MGEGEAERKVEGVGETDGARFCRPTGKPATIQSSESSSKLLLGESSGSNRQRIRLSDQFQKKIRTGNEAACL